jgi:hypothetical protein
MSGQSARDGQQALDQSGGYLRHGVKLLQGICPIA